MLLRFPVPGFEGKYSVDLDGVIWREPHFTETGRFLDLRVCKPDNTNSTEYTQVKLSQKTYRYHRIVALALIPNNNPERTTVNHIDGNKRNNHPSNLEWSSPSENIQHAVANDLFSSGWKQMSEEEHDFVKKSRLSGVSTRRISIMLNRSQKTIRNSIKMQGL